jgi:opacity protein-like surface antigen
MKHTAMIAAILAATATHASAQTMQGGTRRFGDVYAGVSAGALFPADTDQKTSGTLFGVPVSGSGKMRFKPGFIVDLRAGYHLNPYLAVEGDLAYARYTYDKVVGQLTAGPLSIGESAFDGHVSNWLGFVNAIITPLGRSAFTPYVGAGIGFSSYEATVDAISVGGLGRVAVDSKTSNTDFAANALVGFDYAVTGAISVGARYRFIWTDSATSSATGGLTTEAGNARHHAVSATVTYRF